MVENNIGNRGYLSDASNDEGLYPIHGIAIGDNDITIGSTSQEAKLWRPEVIEAAADTLEGKDIVVNHENDDAYLKIGEIEEAKYEEGRGVLYRGAIDDEQLAERIGRDWLEVSPRIRHSKAHEMIEGVKVPEYIQEFDNLSVVRRGAAHSNEVHLGEIDELSIEELQNSFESDSDDEVVEYQDIADDETIEEMDGIDYARWMYDDREGAEGAAQGLGCEGTHAHEIEGETWYMPCETHDKFLENYKENQSDEASEDELSFEEGDHVSWEDGVGRIIECSEIEHEEASEDDPIARVQKFEECEDGWCPVEDEVVELNFSELGYGTPDSMKVEESKDHKESGEYSSEERRIASQLASYSELTKGECLSLVDAFNPARETDLASLSDMLYKIMGKEEKDMFMAHLNEHYEEKSARESPLNKLFK